MLEPFSRQSTHPTPALSLLCCGSAASRICRRNLQHANPENPSFNRVEGEIWLFFHASHDGTLSPVKVFSQEVELPGRHILLLTFILLHVFEQAPLIFSLSAYLPKSWKMQASKEPLRGTPG